MAKKRKVIKRVYERGRETTVFSPKRPNFVKLQEKKSNAAESAVRLKRAASTVQTVTAQQPAGRKPFIDQYDIPSHYDTTRLTLLVKDPFWIYAYWEIALHSLQSLKESLPSHEAENAKIVLRMYEVTLVNFDGTNANYYFDLEIGPHTNNWYINLWHDNTSYIGEIGLRLSGNRFFALARSNCVHTPRSKYSSRSEQIWMKVTDDVPASGYTMPSIKITPYDSKLSRAAAAGKMKRTVHLTEEDIRRYYGSLSPLLKDIISSRLSRLYGKRAARYKFLLEGETDEERRRLLSRLPKDYFIKKVLLGASENMVLLGASEQLAKGGASEFVQEKMQHKFFFELATELIVYGRTEPDAEVWLGDKKIQLEKDGTFSLRFALGADAKIPMEFRAISKDKKEARKINTTVKRHTD